MYLFSVKTHIFFKLISLSHNNRLKLAVVGRFLKIRSGNYNFLGIIKEMAFVVKQFAVIFKR